MHPRVSVGPSPIAGRGLIAQTALALGTVVIRLGGTVVSTEQLHALFDTAAALNTYIDTFAIGDDTHLVLPDHTDIHYGNHSCDPTLWPVGTFELATRRALATGDEITIDYGLISDDPDFSMTCACRTATCRRVITGVDWQRADLQQRYANHWPAGLQRRIDHLMRGNS